MCSDYLFAFIIVEGGVGVGGGCIMRDLDMNYPPAAEMEEEYPMGSVEDEDEGGCGGGGRPKKLRLSKEQSRLLEESFRQNHTLNPVSFSISFNKTFIIIIIIHLCLINCGGGGGDDGAETEGSASHEAEA